jgi:queuine/archaeosine tRNA-ribosyltransferase
MKQLSILSNEYKVQVQKTADLEKERGRLHTILAKLKETLTLSGSQREEFDRLVKDVVSIFDRKRC